MSTRARPGADTDAPLDGWPTTWRPRLGPLHIMVVLVVGAVALVAGITTLVLVVHSSDSVRSVFGAVSGATPAG